MAPAVAGPLVGGGTSSLASYRGHVVVLNFWGSWCSACRQEAPALAAAARRFQPSGVRFLGVDVADDPAGIKAYVRRFGIHFPSLSDPHEAITVGFRRVIPVADFPSTLVISRDGRIVARIIGAVTYRGLSNSIKTASGSVS
jgi:thiol-disulfide isomerase/thioredoxin